MGPSLPLLLAPTVLSQSRGLLRYLMGGTSSPVAWPPLRALMSYLLPSHAFYRQIYRTATADVSLNLV